MRKLYPEFIFVLRKYRSTLWLRISYKRLLQLTFIALSILLLIKILGILSILQTNVHALLFLAIFSTCCIVAIYSRPSIEQAAWIADANMAINNSLFTTALFVYSTDKKTKNTDKLYTQAGQIQLEDLNIPKIWQRHTTQAFLLAGIFILIFTIITVPTRLINPSTSNKVLSKQEKTDNTNNSGLFIRQVRNIKNKLLLPAITHTTKTDNHFDRNDKHKYTRENAKQHDNKFSETDTTRIKYSKATPHSASNAPHITSFYTSKPYNEKKPDLGIENSVTSTKANSGTNNTSSRSALSAVLKTPPKNKRDMTIKPTSIKISFPGNKSAGFHDQLSGNSITLHDFAKKSGTATYHSLTDARTINRKRTIFSQIMPPERKFLANYLKINQ